MDGVFQFPLITNSLAVGGGKLFEEEENLLIFVEVIDTWQKALNKIWVQRGFPGRRSFGNIIVAILNAKE